MATLTNSGARVTPDAAAAIRAALAMVPSSGCDHEIRSAIAGSIKNALGAAGIDIWLAWSRKSDSHRDSSAELQWHLASDQHDENLLFEFAYIHLALRCMARGVS